jgi:hypothetical protein
MISRIKTVTRKKHFYIRISTLLSVEMTPNLLNIVYFLLSYCVL